VPLQSLENIRLSVQNKDTPLFVYCYSGGRSRQAAQQLRAMGYTNVKNLGGIAAYRGRVER
jgi:rhodanese-related sulfurtransferase